MTQPEFDLWWGDLALRFPSVEAWLVKATTDDEKPDELRQRMMLKTWFGVMRETAAEDAMEVNRLMQSGELPFVGDFKQEQIPQHVRRLARQLAWDNNGGSREEPDYEHPQRDTDFPAGKILRRWWELERLGTPRDEARTVALKEFPVGRSRYQPRFNCHLCLDVGRLSVASNAALEAALLDDFENCHHRIGTVRCKCKGHLPVNPKRPLAVYDAGLDFLITDYLWGDEQTAKFLAWVELQREVRAEAVLKSQANYEPAFNSFNQREAF